MSLIRASRQVVTVLYSFGPNLKLDSAGYALIEMSRLKEVLSKILSSTVLRESSLQQWLSACGYAKSDHRLDTNTSPWQAVVHIIFIPCTEAMAGRLLLFTLDFAQHQ
jgi:hypothetical protein